MKFNSILNFADVFGPVGGKLCTWLFQNVHTYLLIAVGNQLNFEILWAKRMTAG
jgi:hypothetical protein